MKKKQKIKRVEEEKISIPRLILRIVIVVIALLLLLFIIKIAPNYAKDEVGDKIKLII